MSHLRRMARYIAAPGAMPAAATERAILALVDLVGVAVAGSAEPVAGIVAAHVAQGRGGASVIGTALRVPAADAALANGAAGHALDLDDSNFVLGGHPTVTMLPALLALAEERALPGAAVLEAYLVGFEVMMKLARAVNFAHYEKGWHPSATIGTFGTAAAAARLVRLDEARARHALGLACSMAAGVKANFGSMAKPFQLGQAARNGLVAALLAEAGLTSAEGALEGPQGFLAVYNGPGQYRAEALACPGETLEILDSGLAFKRYACCGSTHAPVDAALCLVRDHGVRGAEVQAATIAINARRLPHVNRPVAEDPLQAKFSLHYTVAAALTDGALGLGHFTPESVQRADIQDLMRRITAEGREGTALSQGCELSVTLRSGATHRVALADAEGRDAASYPAYMEAKFVDCVAQRFDAALAHDLLPRLLGFDRLDDIRPVMARLRTGEPA